MKKLFFVLAASAAILAASSCAKEMEKPINDNIQPALEKISVKAVHENEEAVEPESRTTLNEGDGSVAWAVGDAIKMVWNGGSAVSDPLVSGGSSATFEVEVGDGTKFAVYPSGIAASYNGSTFSVTVPAAQDGTFANAAIEVAEYPGGAPIEFKNLGGLLQIVVSSASVESIRISSNDSTPLAGTAAVTFDAGLPVIGAVTSTSTSITLDVSGAGTYYAAVLPGSLDSGIYVELLNSSDEVIGEKLTGNTLSVARRQIKKLGTIATSVISNKKFVTVSGSGAKDGSNWENAMGSAEFYTWLTTESTNNTVFMAAGTYPTQTTNGYTINNSTKGLAVYGGYPADATGTSLAGRNIKTNRTILSGDQNGDKSVKNRIIVLNKNTITAVFDGLEFRDALRSSIDIGSAIIINSASNVKFYNCVIADNTNSYNSDSGGGGGAVRAAGGTILFKGCTFSNNTATNRGGAIRSYGTAKLTLDACVFENNSALYGGAVYAAKGTLTVINGTQFNNNTCERTGGALHINNAVNPSAGAVSATISNASFFHNRAAYETYCGGAMYIAGTSENPTNVSVTDCYFEENLGHKTDLETAALKTGLVTKEAEVNVDCTGGAIFVLEYSTLKLDRCYFYHNACSRNGGAIRVREATATLFANRCVFDRNYAGVGAAAITNTSGIVALNNCVFYSNQNKTGDATDATIAINGGECLISNTSLTLASSYHGVVLSTSAKSVLINNIFKNSTSKKSAIAIASGKTVSSFGHNIWSVKDGDGTVDNTNNDPNTDVAATASFSWSDANRYLSLSSLPAAYYKAGTVDYRAALSELTAAVSYFDSQNSTAFGTWLSSIAEGGRNPLNVDVRGYLRSAKIWPGSYQNDATE